MHVELKSETRDDMVDSSRSSDFGPVSLDILHNFSQEILIDFKILPDAGFVLALHFPKLSYRKLQGIVIDSYVMRIAQQCEIVISEPLLGRLIAIEPGSVRRRSFNVANMTDEEIVIADQRALTPWKSALVA